jgi:hypothetical protein
MKKIFSIGVFVCCIILNNNAQPNPSFENWVTAFNYEVPESWQTLNFLQFTLPPNPLSVTKAVGIDVHSGNYALKLKTIQITTNPAPQILDDTMGLIFTGLINISPVYYKQGFPYTSRPDKLTFWFKYLPVGSDTGGVRVQLKKYYDSTTHIVGQGEVNINQNLTYTQLVVDITYNTDDIPDTCSIIFASSKSIQVARVGSVLYVDDVALSGWVGIDEHQKPTEKVTVFPNPAKDNITFELKMEEAKSIRINDIAGKKIDVFFINNSNVTINTSGYQQGIYLYEIVDKNNELLTKGKFNVVK